MSATDIHHVSINVNDVEKAVEFYTTLLGCTVRSDRPDFSFGGAWLDIGDRQLHLIEAEVPAQHGQHFAFLIDDLDDLIARLAVEGIEVREPSKVLADRQTVCFDPSGNWVELHEVGVSALE